jgi:sugar lactone lactonase YvrE
MLTNRPIPTTILVIASLALSARTVSAHPSSGIVVDQQGQIFFQDILGGAIWKIDAQGKLTKYYDKLGGHWMALDAKGSFSRADLKLVKRITPSGTRPSLILADGGAPIVVNPDGNLYYGHELLDGGRVAVGLTRISPDGTLVRHLATHAPGGVAVGLTRISPDGKQAPFSPALRRTLEKRDDGVFGLATGPNDSVYVSTWDAVLRVDQDGTVTTVVHPVVVSDCDEDPADHKPSNRLPYLRGLAVDARGTVYAAATSCHRLLKIAPDGKVETVLKAERPWSPTGVAVHGGEVYVLEYTNANGGPDEGWLPRVRRLGRDGKVTTLATISRPGGERQRN